jgi:hypothetical protein
MRVYFNRLVIQKNRDEANLIRYFLLFFCLSKIKKKVYIQVCKVKKKHFLSKNKKKTRLFFKISDEIN